MFTHGVCRYVNIVTFLLKRKIGKYVSLFERWFHKFHILIVSWPNIKEGLRLNVIILQILHDNITLSFGRSVKKSTEGVLYIIQSKYIIKERADLESWNKFAFIIYIEHVLLLSDHEKKTWSFSLEIVVKIRCFIFSTFVCILESLKLDEKKNYCFVCTLKF